jgi:DNA-binding NarL/FixJ family response regulator
MNEPISKRADRVGVVATDPLRVLGLQAIFSESEVPHIEIVPLSVPGVLNDALLCAVLIDAQCTPHLFELIATFRKTRPLLKLIVLSNHTEQNFIQRVIAAGARGCLSLSADETEIRTAIDTVIDGSVWASRKVLSRLLDADRAQNPAPRIPRFTPRELQVLELLRGGHSNREIARSLGIDEGTVKAHLGRLMRKVGVDNRTALTVHPFTQIE